MRLDQLSNEELFDLLINVVHEIGWDFALPRIGEDDEIPGMVIGRPDYIDAVLNGEYDENGKEDGSGGSGSSEPFKH